MKKGVVSIVVPTHEYRDLTNLERSIENSTYKNIELIIVNKNRERSWQRNYGIDKATGEYLLWLDSDQSISPFLIWECVSMMKRGYDALYIPELIVADSFFGMLITLFPFVVFILVPLKIPILNGVGS